ncbi:MAG: acyl-CoA thioesterase [Archangium sp.]
MSFSIQFPVRFGEVDLARVVYFARYFDFAHRCFEDFFNVHAGVPYLTVLEAWNVGFPIVHSEGQHFAPLRLGDQVRVVMDVVKLSRRSVTSRFTLHRGDEDAKIAVITLKQAAIDTKKFVGIEFPDNVFALFEKQLVA